MVITFLFHLLHAETSETGLREGSGRKGLAAQIRGPEFKQAQGSSQPVVTTPGNLMPSSGLLWYHSRKVLHWLMLKKYSYT